MASLNDASPLTSEDVDSTDSGGANRDDRSPSLAKKELTTAPATGRPLVSTRRSVVGVGATVRWRSSMTSRLRSGERDNNLRRVAAAPAASRTSGSLSWEATPLTSFRIV